MRIADHDFGGARRLGATNRRHGFICHEAAESLVLKSARKQLVRGDDAGDAFHVYRDIDLERGSGRFRICTVSRQGHRKTQESDEACCKPA